MIGNRQKQGNDTPLLNFSAGQTPQEAISFLPTSPHVAPILSPQVGRPMQVLKAWTSDTQSPVESTEHPSQQHLPVPR